MALGIKRRPLRGQPCGQPLGLWTRRVSLALVVQALLGGGVYALKKDNA
jgi:hypothetical protein